MKINLPTHNPYAALRVSSYRKYLIGTFVASLGTRIQLVAIGWEMYQRTGEALALGMVGLIQALPMILFALPAGYIADYFDRKKVIIFSLIGMTMTSLGLAALSHIQGPTWIMYTLLFIDATFVIIGRPARLALVPQIVPRPVFPNAVTWNMSLIQISWVVGPAIGGFVLTWSIPAAYLLSATSSLVFFIGMLRLTYHPIKRKESKVASFQTLLAGLRFLVKERVLLAIISLDMFAVFLGSSVYLLPIFAEDILQVGSKGFGWLNSASAIGSLCMALLLAHLPPMGKAGRNLLIAVGGFGIATIIFGLSKSFWLSMIMLFLAGALDNVSMVIRHTLVQLLTPDWMRGRVSAVNSVFISASNELGGLESGLVAHWFSPVFSVVSGGIGTILVVIIMGSRSPQLRSLGVLGKGGVHDSQQLDA